jgi:hypothetical protein
VAVTARFHQMRAPSGTVGLFLGSRSFWVRRGIFGSCPVIAIRAVPSDGYSQRW